MMKNSANDSLPEQPTGDSSAGAAPHAPQPSSQPPPARTHASPPMAPAQPQHVDVQPQRVAPPPDRRRRIADEAAAWRGQDARPRRRLDREAGPSEKQVYVPPVTLPPNREHQAMDIQKIQVSPALLKGIDERNRPTMRRIHPVMPAAPDTGHRASRVARPEAAVGGGVWPLPEDAAAKSARAIPPRAARAQPACPEPPANAPAPPPAERQNRPPIGRLLALVVLGSAAAAGVWLLLRPRPSPPDPGLAAQRATADQHQPAERPAAPPQPIASAAAAPSSVASVEPVGSAAAAPSSVAPVEPVDAATAKPAAPPSEPTAPPPEPTASAVAKAPSARSTGARAAPSKPSHSSGRHTSRRTGSPDDIYGSIEGGAKPQPSPTPRATSTPSAAAAPPSPTPTTTVAAPPRPFE